ncbi:MAG: hypothetical protein ABFC62_07800 [Clostridiaceae bacterium]|nr:hypothetical protein [Eubacteriales bacterium]
MKALTEIENRMVLGGARPRGAGSRPTKREETASTYAATERRLYAIPILRERIADSREELAELETLGIEALREHSLSLVRILRPGIRLTPEEVHAAQLAELRGRLAADEREVKKVQVALTSIEDDPYYRTVEMKYFRNARDAEVAEKLCCDPSTVRRNRLRLVQRLALRLYGANAL